MKTLIIKGVALGEGRPKICLPLTGRTEEELICQAEEAVKESPDLLEWRADFLKNWKKKKRSVECAPDWENESDRFL